MKKIMFLCLLSGMSIFCGCTKTDEQAAAAKPPAPGSKADQNLCREFTDSIKLLLKDFALYDRQYNNKIELCDQDRNLLGYMLINTDSKARCEGYNGFINTAVILDKNMKIIGIALGRHDETPGYIKRVMRSKFPTQWNELTPAEAAQHKVVNVTRATYSCNAIANEVKNACNIYTAAENEK